MTYGGEVLSHREEELSIGAVLERLEQAREPLRLRDIAHDLELHHRGRRELKKWMLKLVREGSVEETQPGWYVLAGRSKAAKPFGELPSIRRGGLRAGRASPAAGIVNEPDDRGEQASRGGQQPASAAVGDVVSGRLVCHRDGYGFVITDRPVTGVEGDVYIGAAQMGDAMHGDRVEIRVARKSLGRAEGRVLRVVRRAHPTVVGEFHVGASGNYVIPYDTKILQRIFIPPGEESPGEPRLPRGERHRPAVAREDHPSKAKQAPLPSRLRELEGKMVNVELMSFPRGDSPPRGRVTEVLGKPGDLGLDVEIVIRKHHLPHEFAEDVMAEAQRVPTEVRPGEREGRANFCHLSVVTIDGETAKDFDDAVYVEPLANGNFHLAVHIADVSHYVAPGTALDREARLRGTSVYFPDCAVPMLPAELSSGICSLNPRVERLVLSALMEVDRNGQVVRSTFTPGVIRSAERMTYTAVHAVLEGDPEQRKRYAPLARHFENMKELALILNRKRRGRGSIDFDLPEPILRFDERGLIVGITRSERNIAHRIIEEFMLAANEAVARFLEACSVGTLYRIHEKPDPRKVLEFEEIAQRFGYSLGVADLAERKLRVKQRLSARSSQRGRAGHRSQREFALMLPPDFDLAITPRHYQKLADKIEGKPEERILSYLMLRSLKQARYSGRNLGHFALAAATYCHFTSPIRRYPDLIVHRTLKWLLAASTPAEDIPGGPHPRAGKKRRAPGAPGDASHAALPQEVAITRPDRMGSSGPISPAELENIAAESSDAERRADDAERELTEWKKVQFMGQHLGQAFDALIIQCGKFGFFVELLDFFVEGLVSIDSLEDLFEERFFYREGDRAIVGEPAAAGRKRFAIGDRVRVQVDRVDAARQRVDFSLVEG